MPSLEKQVAQRIKEAEEKDISGKADVIARGLGSGGKIHHPGVDGEKYTFQNKEFFIDCSSGSADDGYIGFSGVKIEYDGQEVYREGGYQIYSFIPGEWEVIFNQLYKKACSALDLNAKEVKVQEKKQQKEAELKERKKWGL